MSIPPTAEMLLRNKEPSVTKNQDFPCHLPSKEGTNQRNSNLLSLLLAKLIPHSSLRIPHSFKVLLYSQQYCFSFLF